MEFDDKGVRVRTFLEIFTKKTDGYKDIYGQEINVDQNTQDGQKIGLESNAILDLELAFQWLYSQLDPDFSQGQMLNVIAKICGITRIPTTRSICDVAITTDRALTLPAGWEAKDANDAIWFTQIEIDLVQGVNQVTLSSKDWGAVSVQSNEIIFQNHIVLGIVSLTNANPSTLGVDEESDEDFRIRRNLSTENPAFSTLGELQSGLSNLNGVTGVRVYENKTDVLDTVLSMEAHSIWVIVDGGSVADISKTIAISKTAGTGEKGAITGSYVEEIETDLGLFSYAHEPVFDRSTSLSTELIFTVASTVGVVDLAKFEALKDLEFGIGVDVSVTSLYSEVYGLHGGITVENLSVVNVHGSATNIATVDAHERFKIDTLTISVA